MENKILHLKSLEEATSYQEVISVKPGWNARPAFGLVSLGCRIKNGIYLLTHYFIRNKVISVTRGDNAKQSYWPEYEELPREY